MLYHQLHCFGRHHSALHERRHINPSHFNGSHTGINPQVTGNPNGLLIAIKYCVKEKVISKACGHKPHLKLGKFWGKTGGHIDLVFARVVEGIAVKQPARVLWGRTF